MMSTKFFVAIVAAALVAVLPATVLAQSSSTTVTDDFTGAAASNDWQPFNGACLTAGSGSGTVPGCIGLNYYNGQNLVGGNLGYLGASAPPSIADPVGKGALRFTNGYPNGYSQNGAIVSNFTYPNNQGLQVTFTTVTYRGNSGSPISDGADGISFFLMDGAKAPDIGAWGGSLGYSCSNSNPPYRGIDGGYVAVGIDEYGNFLNGTSLMPGYTGGNSASGDNTAWGYGYHPGRIGMRGAGNVTFGELSGFFGVNPGNSATPYYPASMAQSCNITGGTYDSSSGSCIDVCPAGSTYYAAGNVCNKACVNSTYDPSNDTCNACASVNGTYDPTSQMCINTTACPSGTTYYGAAQMCESCPVSGYATGSYNSAGQCVNSCPSGYAYTASHCYPTGAVYSSGYYCPSGSTIVSNSGVYVCYPSTSVYSAGYYCPSGNAINGTYCYPSGDPFLSGHYCASGQSITTFSGSQVCYPSTGSYASGFYCASGKTIVAFSGSEVCYPNGKTYANDYYCPTTGNVISGTNCCPSGTTYSAVTGKCSNGSTPTAATLATAASSATTASAATGATVANTATVAPASQTIAATQAATLITTPGKSAPATTTPTTGRVDAAYAVQNTCKTGTLWNYSTATAPTNAGPATTANPANVGAGNAPKILDYAPITAVNSAGLIVGAYQELPAGQLIANEAAVKRSDGIPITYNLKITSDNKLSMSYQYQGGATQSVITNQDITSANGPLPATLRFGFAGSTGGSTNIHEIMCFKVTPADQAQSSAGLNEKQSARVETGTQVYFAFYNPSNWAGSLTSHMLLQGTNTTTGQTTLTIGPAKWDGSCVLTGVATGGSCAATGVVGGVTAQGSSQRTILSWNGAGGIPFSTASLSANELSALNAGDSQADNRVQYLRGDRTNEINSLGQGLFRYRVSVLGDIVDSSPTWVGAPSGSYPDVWKDNLNSSASLPENSGQTYSSFISSTQQRLNVVYSGANDGMLHAFRSGVFTDPKTYDPTLNDGKEVLAYIPGATIAGAVLGSSVSTVDTIHGTDPTNSNAVTNALDYSGPQYGHNFYVDAPPGTGDVFYGGAWHTWLVGGMGPGGAAIYALDITDPTQFSESNASSLVLGEWNAATLSCTNNSGCGANLGNTFGVPQIRRFHNGQWGAVFGNGLGSSTGDAGVFVMLIDSSSGARSFYYLSAGKAGSGDGIAYATPADLDGDHIVDYVYAGDLLGNVWRFDLTSSSPSSWKVSASSPLFTTPSGQPITTKVAVVSVPTTLTGPGRVMVDFGTGRQVPVTNSSAASYASAAQSLYGIWDWDMGAWNAQPMAAQYASLSSAPTASLVTQTTTLAAAASGSTPGYRTVTSQPVCWVGSATCGSGNVNTGWTLALPDTSGKSAPYNTEQVIYSPVIAQGTFIVNTTVPPDNSPTSCTTVSATGWTMGIDPATGGAFKTSFFGDQNGNFVTVNNKVVNGIQLSGTGSPTVVTTDASGSGANTSGVWLVTQTASGTGAVVGISPPAAKKGGRVTWIERR
jgi:type IV pilus assembly protein PilY1